MHQYQLNNTILRWWQNPLLCANMRTLQKFNPRAFVMRRSHLTLWHHAHLHTHENKHCDCAACGGLRSGVINFGPQTGLCAAKQPLSTDTGLFEPRHQTYQLPLHANRPGRRSTDCSLYQNVSGGGSAFEAPEIKVMQKGNISGNSTEGGNRSSPIQNQTWLWVYLRQTLVRKLLTWERPRAQPVVWMVSQHHGQRSSLTSVPPPSNHTNQEKTLERCRGCQRHFCKGCL